MLGIAQDVRYALRGMRRSPGFAAVAGLSLALGIGANTAIFSLIDTVMLRTLPVREPERVVELLNHYPGEPRTNGFSWQSYQHFRDNNHVFSDVIAIGHSPFVGDEFFHVTFGRSEPERVYGSYVTGDFFEVLGVKAAVGRMIEPSDSVADSSSSVAVISWAYWNRRFGRDPAVVGRKMDVEGRPLTIIGVAARDFWGVAVGSHVDLWLPLAIEPALHSGPRYAETRFSWLSMMARLKPGVSLEQANAEAAVLYQWTIDQKLKTSKDPLVRQLKIEVAPAGAGLARGRDPFSKSLVALMAVVGLLLLIACTNVASMLLARGAGRRREMAVRVSLGASRFRLVRQMLTESLLLAAAGSAAGLMFAYFATGALERVIAGGLFPVSIDAQLDWHVLLFTAAVALSTGLFFGMAPAWSAFRSAPAFSLRDAPGDSKPWRLFGKGLVAAQVALSLVLVTAAGLFVRDVRNLLRDPGFQPDRVLLITLDPARSGLSNDRLVRTYAELLDKFQAIPGVRSATLSAVTPISGAGASRFVNAEGHAERPEDRRYVALNWIAPRYFETLGQPFLAGRDFRPGDRDDVAIVNQTMARRYFAGRNPVGLHFSFDGSTKSYEIVGVAGDAKSLHLRETVMSMVYMNALADFHGWSHFELRTSGRPSEITPEVRRAVRDLSQNITIARSISLADQMDGSIVPERLVAWLSGFFGFLGAALMAIGLYGLLAYTVVRRTHEIGIRMAVGADRRSIGRMVLAEAIGMLLAGVLTGAPLAWWAERAASGMMQGLPHAAVGPIAWSAVGMFVVAVTAAYLPARRAADLDPMEALRSD